MHGPDEARSGSRPAGALARPRYLPGDALLASDLRCEQDYRRQRLRRHNRLLHGWGVVCGLEVVPARNPRLPWSVSICPGYALGPYGDEIAVAQPVSLDVREALWKHAGDAAGPTGAYVVIRASEQAGRRSATSEGFEAKVLWTLPPLDAPGKVDLCRHPAIPCPECRRDPTVVLARIALPSDESLPIRREDIENWGP